MNDNKERKDDAPARPGGGQADEALTREYLEGRTIPELVRLAQRCGVAEPQNLDRPQLIAALDGQTDPGTIHPDRGSNPPPPPPASGGE